MPRIIDRHKLEQKLEEVDRAEYSLWIHPQWVNKSVSKRKRELFIEFLGHQLNDEKYERMKENIKKYPELSELIDDLVDRGRGEFILSQQAYDAFRKACVAYNEDSRKQYLTSAKRLLNEYNDILKYDHGISEDGKPVPGPEPGLETFAANKETNRKAVHKKNLDTLVEKVYDEQFVDPYSIDWGSPDVTLDEYKAAAAIVADNGVDIWNYNYSYKKCLDAKKAIDNDINTLANDADFRGYVKEVLSKNDKSLFEKDVFKSGWENYQLDLKNMRENTKDWIMFGSNQDMEADLSTTSVARVKAVVNVLISETYKGGKVFTQRDEMEACDHVIAKVFAGPTFDKNLLGSEMGADTEEGAFIFNSSLNLQVRDMREQLKNDPVFKRTLAERVDRKSFFDVYKANVKKEVNKFIKAEAEADKAFENNQSRKAQHEKYMKETPVKFTKAMRDFYSDIQSFLEDTNGTKKPSKYMKRLMNALDKVLDRKHETKVADINELNKAALSYYKERQGLIFSPFTDNGKARLDLVESLVRFTNKEMKAYLKAEDEFIHNKNNVAEAPKVEEPKKEEPKKEELKASGKRKIGGLGPKVMI